MCPVHIELYTLDSLIDGQSGISVHPGKFVRINNRSLCNKRPPWNFQNFIGIKICFLICFKLNLGLMMNFLQELISVHALISVSRVDFFFREE